LTFERSDVHFTMRRNHPNFRRGLKNLRKNLQRGQINKEDIGKWFEDRGIWIGQFPTDYFLREFLQRTDIPGRILSRIGNAAKKRGMLVSANDLLRVGQTFSDFKRFNGPPFFRIEREEKEIVKKYIEIRRVTADGHILEVYKISEGGGTKISEFRARKFKTLI